MWGEQAPVSTSPATDLLIRSLQTLDLHDGAHVLELGTCTGHTTALLAHRLGDQHVTSVEIDLHHLARRHLHTLSIRPRLLLGDSAHPGTSSERYDRILVGHDIMTVVVAWLEMLRPGGLLHARFSGGLGAGHHALLEHAPRVKAELVGHFLEWTDPLSPHRAPATRRGAGRRTEPLSASIRSGNTTVEPTALTDSSVLAFLSQLHLPPGTQGSVRATGDASLATYLHAPDGSWAEINHAFDRSGRHDTRQAGPTRLVPAVERARDEYHDLGRPGWTDLGVTATRDGAHVWHSSPDTGPTWPVPPHLGNGL